jgi:hypothetical protein
LGKSIGVAAKAGQVPAVLASNANFAANDATLADLQRLARAGAVRRHLVIERGSIRFGLIGLLGKAGGAGAVTFSDAIETAKEMVKVLRETEKVDVVIALSHGGVEKAKDGRYTDGDDVRLAHAVPGIDVVIGGHRHTVLLARRDRVRCWGARRVVVRYTASVIGLSEYGVAHAENASRGRAPASFGTSFLPTFCRSFCQNDRRRRHPDKFEGVFLK